MKMSDELKSICGCPEKGCKGTMYDCQDVPGWECDVCGYFQSDEDAEE